MRTSKPNEISRANRRYASPPGAVRQFGRAVYALPAALQASVDCFGCIGIGLAFPAQWRRTSVTRCAAFTSTVITSIQYNTLSFVVSDQRAAHQPSSDTSDTTTTKTMTIGRANRRPASPPNAGRQLGRAIHAPPALSAAVAGR